MNSNSMNHSLFLSEGGRIKGKGDDAMWRAVTDVVGGSVLVHYHDWVHPGEQLPCVGYGQLLAIRTYAKPERSEEKKKVRGIS